VSDELNHASIVDACRLSKARIVIYRHKDMEDLKEKLSRSRAQRKLVVTDGVFSMDGDIAPLPTIIKLAKQYNAMTMVDDAHATGVLGRHGGGTLEHFGLAGDSIDIYMGTFTKAIGAVGGFIAGKKFLIDYLRVAARPYMFSAPIPPSITAAIIVALEEITTNPSRREKMWANTVYLRHELKSRGFNILQSETPILPLIIGKEDTAIAFVRKLLERGIFAPCYRWPAVPKNTARLRLTVMATHTRRHLAYLLETLTTLAREFQLLPNA
jgi:7-keto-8-aminopelargonate synthetase-like enzyme